VYDAIVGSAYANGLDRDRKNGGITKIQINVDRGLDKATHEFDWTQVDWRTANGDNVNESDDFGDDGESDDGAAHTWTPVDLTNALDGTWKPPDATVGRRIDGVGLFYPGKKHTVSSESEAGKTWFALAACRDEIIRENHVFYVDFEDDGGPVTARLMMLGVDAKRIAEFFHYIRPETPIFLSPNDSDIAGALDRYRPTLSIVDGVTEAMTLHELNPSDNSDAARFGRMLPRLLAESGSAAVSLDHVTKSSDGRGRYSIGAVHKLNGLDGAAYLLDNRTPFGVGLKGVSTIRIAKDRPGQLRKQAVPNKSGMYWFADLVVDTTLDGLAEGVATVVPSVDRGTEPRPTKVMGRICKALADQDGGLAQRVLCDVVTGKAATIRLALSYLIADGYVTSRTPHKLVRPYVPDEDFGDDDDDDD
jgi:hypothetical protein